MRVVRRVDHVPVYVSDPHILFNVLTERLGLPAGMPVTRLPGFQSGVVVLGNVGLEVIRPGAGPPRRRATGSGLLRHRAGARAARGCGR